MTHPAHEPLIDAARSLGFEQRDEPAPNPRDILEFIWVLPEQLVIDRGYQRRISNNGRRKINGGIAGFDWRQFGAITVVRLKNGKFAVIDGQHRALMAWAVNAEVVPAICFNADMADQAMAFVGINTNRSTVASIDKFRARVAAGDANACTVHEILNDLEISADVAAGTSLRPRQTRAVTKLEKLVKIIGRGLTFTTLELMLDAQPDQTNLLTAFSIEATAGAVARIVDQGADLDRFAKILEEIDFDSLKDNCAQIVKLQGGQTSKHGTVQLLRSFNKGLQKKVAA